MNSSATVLRPTNMGTVSLQFETTGKPHCRVLAGSGGLGLSAPDSCREIAGGYPVGVARDNPPQMPVAQRWQSPALAVLVPERSHQIAVHFPMKSKSILLGHTASHSP